MINFSLLQSDSSDTILEPRSIFMSLPSKHPRYEYPRDVQAEVWEKWFEKKDNKNSILKMNTGSGKTVVGLLILKSCLNEGKGPAVYVVPDNFLVGQVKKEADALGIEAVIEKDDISFLQGKAILIINIHTLVNGKSYFGMQRDGNIEVTSILIDDVHACLASIEEQFTIKVPARSEIYQKLFSLFSESLKKQSESKFLDIKENYSPFECMLVPFWTWQENHEAIYNILSQAKGERFLDFSFPLLRDCLKLSQCMVSATEIEITPICIPIHKISSFSRAERRIFMSATLSDDSVFSTSLDVDPSDVDTIITPRKANDIGDRLIIFPQAINKNITIEEIKGKLKEYSKNFNVVVIVPSFERVKYWSTVADIVLNNNTISEGIEDLKSRHIGLVIIVNRYDGIDLPDDACRILAIDGLPNVRSRYDSYEQNANPSNRRLRREQIQKIEQGMGRGVRSSNDYCSVVLIGKGLVDILYTGKGIEYFSDATKKQFEISEKIWSQLRNPSLEDIFSLLNYSLNRDKGWVSASRSSLSDIKYQDQKNFDSSDLALRKAFNVAENLQVQEAVEILTEECNNSSINQEQKGLLKQYIATFKNLMNPIKAQEILLSANQLNKMILKPIQGIQYQKATLVGTTQAETMLQYILKNEFTQNDYLVRVNSLLEKLTFNENPKSFEYALKEIGLLLGFHSSRPEDEVGKGPDNFWISEDNKFMVIECKNGTTTEQISKHDCNQLNGSIIWFESLYPTQKENCYPIMIHNSSTFTYECSPNPNIRIITPPLLEKLKGEILNFANNVVNPSVFSNPVEISKLLQQLKLTGKLIYTNFTTTFKKYS